MKKINLKFSDGWLEYFKKRWKLKTFRLHEEGGNIDESAVQSELSLLQKEISRFNEKDNFNCDEFALFWQIVLDRTIATSTFSGRKNKNRGLNFLHVAMQTGSER